MVFLLVIDGANGNAITELSILQLIISTFSINVEYEKALSGKPNIKKKNWWCRIQRLH